MVRRIAEFHEVENTIAGLRFRSKDLTKFLQNYHLVRELPCNLYPPPTTKGFAGASGGLSLITTVNPKDDSKEFNALFASFGLSGHLDSYSGVMSSGRGFIQPFP